MHGTLTDAIFELAKVIREASKQHETKAILHRLAEMEYKIMAKISEFAAAQKVFNDRQAAAIDSLVASTGGLVSDVQSLNDKITELQNSSGEVNAEDAELLDQAQAQAEALAIKAEAVAGALKALDDQTPPVVPPPV